MPIILYLCKYIRLRDEYSILIQFHEFLLLSFLQDGTLTNLASADKDLLKKRHSELIENVKNVQGYNRGAERGFTAIYPDCIHVLTNSVSVPELATWFRKVKYKKKKLGFYFVLIYIHTFRYFL